MKVTDNREGYDKLLKQIAELKNNPHAAIGVLGEGGGGDFGVVEYATANEFGTISNGGHIPERSFIRSTMDENANDLLKTMEKEKINILTRKTTVKDALGKFGAMIQSLIQKKITDLDDPPNAESTVAKKGSSNPLIDTGRMRSSIAYKVRLRGDL